MRLLLFAILVLVSLSWSFCLDHDRDIVDCFYDTTSVWPTYSDGQKINKGEQICWGTIKPGYITTFIDTTYEIPFVVKYPYKQVCRVVLNIFVKRIDDFISVADTGFCFRKYSSLANQETCVRRRWETKKQKIQKPIYITEFSKEKYYTQDFEASPIYEIKQTETVFYDTTLGKVELYREDGTLRYEGYVHFQDLKLSTHGNCFDKNTGAMGRKTNKPDICK